MRIALAALCTALVFSACSAGPGREQEVFPKEESLVLLEELENHYAAWKSLNIYDYRFEAIYSQVSPDYDGYITTTVRNGINENTINRWQEPVDAGYKTIEALFDKIRKDITDDEYGVFSGPSTKMFHIWYDPEYHYPSSYGIAVPMNDYGFSKDVGTGMAWLVDLYFMMERFTVGGEIREIPPERAELIEEHAAWKAYDIQNYTFCYHYLDWFSNEENAEISVKDGIVDSAKGSGGFFEYTLKLLFNKTMAEMLSIEEDEVIFSSPVVNHLEIEYDPQYRFITAVNKYRIEDGVKMLYSEFTVKDFIPLEE